jgi:hypothetical protein
MDERVGERVELGPSSDGLQKFVGATVLLLVVGAVISIPFLPSKPTIVTAYDVCGNYGIARATVNESLAEMRQSTGTREEKLAAFMKKFESPRNEAGILSCGEAILRDAERPQ